jgi:uncharacterized protein (PEP-CTERM system associated)
MRRALARVCRAVAAWSLAGGLAAFPLAAVAGDWTVTPGISSQENYTDNVLLTPTNRQSDFFTTISPSLSITGQSARLQGTFNYSPTAYLYALTPALDTVGQNLYANGTATLVPHLFFLDANAYASLLPTIPGLTTGGFTGGPSIPGANFGGIGTASFAGIPTNQLTQATSFEASPYLARRFDGFGTGELRYTVTDTNTSSSNLSNPLAPPGFALQNGNQLINEGTAAFLTGENFGRFASRVVLDTAQSSGTGVLQSTQTIGVADSGYAITRQIFALGTIGYEHLHFGGIPPTRIDDVVWGIGTRLMPRPNATITALYEHRNGVTAPYVSVYYPVTARTTLGLTYSEGLTTTSQQIADQLAVSALNPTGQTVDVRTLLPAAIANPIIGLQSGLFRSRQLTGTATLALERNQFSLSAYRYTDFLVAQSAPGLGVSQQTTGGTAQWTRKLNPRTTGNLGLGYTHFDFPTRPQFAENLLTAGVSITYMLTRSVNGWAGYSVLHRTSPAPQLHLLSNVVFVGLSKSF